MCEEVKKEYWQLVIGFIIMLLIPLGVWKLIELTKYLIING